MKVLVALAVFVASLPTIPALAPTDDPHAGIPVDLTSTSEAATTPLGREEQDPQSLPEPLHSSALGHLLQVERFKDPAFIRATVWAHLERLGSLPAGTVAELEASDPNSTLTFRFAHPLGDVNRDGEPDLALNELTLPGFTSHVRVVSGKDASPIWDKTNHMFIPFFWRPGLPFPRPPGNVLTTHDFNSDGVGDLVVFGFDVKAIEIPHCGYVIELTGAYRMLSGSDGKEIWIEPYAGQIVELCTEPSLLIVLNLPTGLVYAEGGDKGPRVVYKQTSYQVATVWLLPPLPSWLVQFTEVTDYVKVLDARTGQKVWDRFLLPTDHPRFTPIRWLTGVANLAGSAEPEVVLDEFLWSNPQNPDIGPGFPLVALGRAMAVRALKGEDGSDLWRTMIFEEPPERGYPPNEEPFPLVILTHALLLEDVTGDQIPDPVALYLTADYGAGRGTLNGMMRTNAAPLNGTSGHKLWKEIDHPGSWHKDRQFVGWGFPAALNTPGHVAPYLVIGTVDIPTQAHPSGGRFPPKDVHFFVVGVKSGQALWTWSQRYTVDSGIVYGMTLNQYLEALAPYDWDGDGMRDLVTPAQYHRPTGRNQVLLSTAEHSYQVLSTLDAHVIQTFKAWATMGQVVNCGRYEPDFTVIAGHSRRFDAFRFNGTTGQLEWRRPVYNDPRPRPATAGVDLVRFHAACAPLGSRDLINLNFWTYALGRGAGGHELYGLYGVVEPDTGTLRWVVPRLQGNPPIEPIMQPIEFLSGKNPWWSSVWVAALAPALPSLALGIGATYYLGSRPANSRPPKGGA